MATNEEIDVRTFSLSDLVMLTAAELDRQGQTQFDREHLAVEAWKRDKKRLGLKKYHDEHPDVNKVYAAMAGDHGLHRRGLLVKMGPCLYAITKAGREFVRRLTTAEGNQEPDPTEPVEFSRVEAAQLSAWLESAAHVKLNENRKSELSFSDACEFWGINLIKPNGQVKAILDMTAVSLDEYEETLAQADGKMKSGRVVTAGDIRALANLHRYLLDRFDRHLKLITTRSKP